MRASSMRRARSTPPNQQKMLRMLMLLIFGALIGVAVIAILFSQDPENPTPFLPSAQAQANYQSEKVDPDHEPGFYYMEMYNEETGELMRTDAIYRKPFQAPKADKGSADAYVEAVKKKLADSGGTLTPALSAQLEAFGKISKPPLIEEIRPIIEDDLHFQPDQHIKREFIHSPHRPFHGADPKKGPFHRIRMSETSWLAQDETIKTLSMVKPGDVKATSNDAPFFGISPEIVPGYRGRVFHTEGRLYMLRRQPVKPFNYHGKQITDTWFGIITFIRAREGYDPKAPSMGDFIQEAVAFTSLTLPEELKSYALEPDADIGIDDELAKKDVIVSIDGVYLRRVMVWEPIAEMKVVTPPDLVKPGEDPIKDKQYSTECFMPLLIAPVVESTGKERYLPDAPLKEVVTSFREAMRAADPQQKDKFDEAGYYMLLDAVDDPNHPLHDVPTTDLNYRMLIEPQHRDAYRAARVRVRGRLQSEYFPLLLKPNVSGRRAIYRSYIAESGAQGSLSTELQWYVDVLEPPLEFLGSPPVMVDGFYYRSQNLALTIDGKQKRVHWPVLIAPKILPEDGGLDGLGGFGFNPWVIVITLICSVLVVVSLIALSRKERRRRDEFEQNSLQRIRRSMADGKAAASAAEKKPKAPGAREPKPKHPDSEVNVSSQDDGDAKA